MASTNAQKTAFDTLRQFADSWSKQASAKTAAPLSEPGGYAGPSTHPSASIDDGLQEQQEGSHAKDNAQQLREPQHPAGTTSDVSEATPSTGSGAQDAAQMASGTTQSATGEDPKTEDDYKGDKDDPGTAHPAKASVGEKYSADQLTQKYASLPLNALLTEVSQLHAAVLADIAVRGKEAATQPAAKPATKAAEATEPAAAAAVAEAAQAGYDAAAQAGHEKVAAVHEFYFATIKDAAHQAELVARYLTAVKQAEDGDGDADDQGSEGEHAPAGAEHKLPPAAAEGGAAGGPVPGLDAVMGQMAGDSGAGPEGAPSQDQALEALNQALQQMGLTPEMLLEALEGAAGNGAAPGGAAPGGAAPGGMDPAMAAGGDPAAAASMGAETKLSSDQRQKIASLAGATRLAKRQRLSGDFEYREPKTAYEQRLCHEMKGYIKEALRTVRR